MEPKSTDSRVAATLSTIDSELGADLSVGALARRAHLSPSRLAHIFKREVHTPIEAYVRSRRLARAVSLLLSTPLTVKEVANEVGFISARHFTRVFKQHFGHTPTWNRKQQKQGIS